MTKTRLFLALMALILALGLVPAGVPAPTVRAQEDNPLATSFVYLPHVRSLPKVRAEYFDTDPGWKYAYLKNDPSDGSFEHSPVRQNLQGHITDNSALMAAWPENWDAGGDFMLEVKVRHVSPLRKSLNGAGLAFNLRVSEQDPTDHDFYALVLAMGDEQHFWAVVRFKDMEGTILTNINDEGDGTYRGGPNFMLSEDRWNELEIRVVDGEIYALCNDKWLPGGIVKAKDVNMVDGHGVGVVLTSYEFDEGEVEFDKFRLTRLHPGDPEYEEVIAYRDRMSAQTIELDTPALEVNLH